MGGEEFRCGVADVFDPLLPVLPPSLAAINVSLIQHCSLLDNPCLASLGARVTFGSGDGCLR